MNDEQRIRKIREIEADFNVRLEEHRRRIRDIVNQTVRRIDEAKAQSIMRSLKGK
ncbi:MAG: hypothetical protein HY974_00800 [Candidatus Kerfeldbacteria bacterium]|nr:hypothetical protein [Candidatus Kerfeldbacteria bacterium]